MLLPIVFLFVSDGKKWDCKVCTYINFFKSLQCVQCYAPKPTEHVTWPADEFSSNVSPSNSNLNTSSNDSYSSNVPSESTHKLRLTPLGSNDLEDSNVIGEKHKLSVDNEENNRSPSDTLTSCDKESNTPVLDSYKISNEESLNKWFCSSCTYANWPCSTKCVMCSTPHNISTKEDGDNSSLDARSGGETSLLNYSSTSNEDILNVQSREINYNDFNNKVSSVTNKIRKTGSEKCIINEDLKARIKKEKSPILMYDNKESKNSINDDDLSESNYNNKSTSPALRIDENPIIYCSSSSDYIPGSLEEESLITVRMIRDLSFFYISMNI